jgi:hypothetical protein
VSTGGDAVAYEATVWRVVNVRLKEYCDGVLLSHGRIPGAAVAVTVLTTVSLRHVRDEVRERIDDFIERDLGARADVDFTVQADLASPGCDLRFSSALDAGEEQDAAPEPDEPAAPLWLRLAYAGMKPWSYALTSDAAWIPLGRNIAGDGQRPPISLPDYAGAVPRAPLLQIQYWQGVAQWRRAPLRSRYAVHVDGQRLTHGQVRPCGPAGTIEYVGTAGRTRLDYHLGWEDAS